MLEQVISNKAGWTRVAFGDVVRKVSDKVDPWESGLERYVAGDHMDTDDLRIRRWGLIGDDYLGPAFHMRFKPGHVLYGSRRTYLRKVALADFEGITANTTYVLETKDPNVLMPELLPFIMQTEAFHAHSIGRSKGSVNPYVNFSDIECFEFSLPPIQEQARLIEALSSSRALAETLEDALETSARLHAAFVLQMVEQLRNSAENVAIGEIAEVQYGLTVNRVRRHKGSTKPYLRVANVQRGRFDFDEIKEIGVLDGDENFTLRSGDVLVVEGHANRQEIGRAAMWQGEIADMMHQNHLIRVRTGSRAEPRFTCELINSPVGQEYFQSRAKSSSGLNTINSTVVREFQLPLPSIEAQRQELAKLDQISAGAENIKERLLNARKLFKMLLNGDR